MSAAVMEAGVAPVRRSLIVLLFALGCARADKASPASAATPLDAGASAATQPAPAAPKPPAVKLSPEKERALAGQLHGEAATRHASYLALAANAGDQASTIARLNLGLKVFNAPVRFPEDMDVPGLEATVRAVAAKLSWPVVSLTAKPVALARRTLPAEVPDGTAIELGPEDVRGIIEVNLMVAVPPTADALAKLSKETLDAARLVWWTKASPATHDGGPALALRGEAYYFYPDVVVPKVAHKPPRLEDALAKLGVPAKPADAEAAALVGKARALYDEMAAKLGDYLKVLALIRDTRLLRARFAFVRQARGRLEAAANAPVRP